MRTIKRIIYPVVLFAAIYYFLLRPSPPPAPVEPTDDLPIIAINKLLKWKITKSRPVTFTIADKNDLPNVHNIQEKLETWGRSSNYVVLCLDVECMTMHAPGLKRIDVGMVRGGRETILILFAHHLATSGHPFLYMAPSICLTGTNDPFSRMLKVTDDTWDLQFMEESNKLDPGFFMARPTQGTQRYFAHAVSMKRDKKTKNRSATYILREAMRGVSVRFKLLDTEQFKSWSDHQDWESVNFATEEEIDVLQKYTTVIHFTCIDPSVQPYFGKLFGGWSNYNGYYTNIRGRYLKVTGIAGASDQVVNFLALMVQIALNTGRILILPYHVELIQKRTKESGHKVAPEHVRVPTFPLYRVIDLTTLDDIVPYAEASFSLNREKYSWTKKIQARLNVTEDLLSHDEYRAYPRIVQDVAESAGADVVWIDLTGFEMRSWEFSEERYEYIRQVKEKLRVCGNINEKETACGKRCT